MSKFSPFELIFFKSFIFDCVFFFKPAIALYLCCQYVTRSSDTKNDSKDKCLTFVIMVISIWKHGKSRKNVIGLKTL